MNLQMECFNFEMFCLESEQSINTLLFSENAEMISLNEAENKEGIINRVGKSIAKIFDNIAMFIDKVVQQAKKKMATIGFKSAKEKMEQIRQSTKDITSDEEVELKFNDAPFITKAVISSQDVESLTGLFNFSTTTISVNAKHDFIKRFIENKNVATKAYAIGAFCKEVGVSFDNEDLSIQNVIDKCKSSEKIKAKSIRNKVGSVETQLKELDEFITKDFKGCLDELIKVRNTMRKQSATLRTASFNFKFGPELWNNSDGLTKKDFSKIASLCATTYSTYVHTMTSYLFATIRTQLSCFKHNIGVLSSILL